jgi:glycosyltransferase involved in cell wall biosynthesis
LRRRPFVAHFHLDVDPSGRLGGVFLAYKALVLGRMLRAAVRVIVLSDGMAQFVADRYGVRGDAIAVMPNAVGPEFSPRPQSERRPGGPCRLLFVGRIVQQKALPRLVHAIALMRQPVDVTIVGTGEDFPAIEGLVHELGLGNVRLTGAQYGEDLVRWYQWADVFVAPSEKEGGVSLVMLEAMASGLPVVATDVQGSGEALGETGLLVAPDPQSLADALDRVAGDAGLRAELAARSLLRVQDHSWPRYAARLECLYDEIAP